MHQKKCLYYTKAKKLLSVMALYSLYTGTHVMSSV